MIYDENEKNDKTKNDKKEHHISTRRKIFWNIQDLLSQIHCFRDNIRLK